MKININRDKFKKFEIILKGYKIKKDKLSQIILVRFWGVFGVFL